MKKKILSKTRQFQLAGKQFSVCLPDDQRPPRVAFNTRLLLSSWGGANQFLKQFAPYLAAHGAEVVYELDPRVTHIFILDVRPIVTATFSMSDIANFIKKFPDTVVINRVNNCDKKYTAADYVPGYEDLDGQMMDASEMATHSIFISNWLKDYFIEKGYTQHAESAVIQNAADPETFYPGNKVWDGQEKMKLVTHHWSDNWLKGFKVYQQVDELIASGQLEGFELTVIGRWPEEIQWKAAKTYGPCQGADLANKLREQHLYLTASLWEPGGMHFIEGMQCGLPVVYHEDGGGIPEVAQEAGICFRDNVKRALLEARSRYQELRNLVLVNAPSGQVLCQRFGNAMGLSAS
ncbi:MAG: glycosyltransferase [Verrucomicrobiota bacterium]